MLSKTSIVMMGLLCEEDLSAYDMLKRIEHMNMKYWWPIGNTTLYETAVRLEKKNYIVGTQQGNKLVYHITDAGHRELEEAIRTIFTRMDYDTIWMSLAVLYCKVLQESELKIILQQRKSLLEEYYQGIQMNQKYHEKLPNIPIEAALSVERMLRITELEQKLLEQLERAVCHKN